MAWRDGKYLSLTSEISLRRVWSSANPASLLLLELPLVSSKHVSSARRHNSNSPRIEGRMKNGELCTEQ